MRLYSITPNYSQQWIFSDRAVARRFRQSIDSPPPGIGTPLVEMYGEDQPAPDIWVNVSLRPLGLVLDTAHPQAETLLDYADRSGSLVDLEADWPSALKLLFVPRTARVCRGRIAKEGDSHLLDLHIEEVPVDRPLFAGALFPGLGCLHDESVSSFVGFVRRERLTGLHFQEVWNDTDGALRLPSSAYGASKNRTRDWNT